MIVSIFFCNFAPNNIIMSKFLKFSLSMAMLLLALSAGAVPALHRLMPVKQADGTTINVYLNGDEHFAYYTSEDGKVLARNAAGFLCYAIKGETGLVASEMVAHDIDKRNADERLYVADKAIATPAIQDVITTARANSPLRSAVSSSTDGLGVYGKPSLGDVTSIGQVKLPVIMVEFSDVKFHDGVTTEKLNRYLNEEGYNDEKYAVGSARDYFVAQSNGKFVPQFDVVGKATLANPVSYYGANTGGKATDKNVAGMVTEAIQQMIDQGVDFSPYVVNGVIQNVSVFYAGYGEASGGGDDTIWPHFRPDFSGNIGGYFFKTYFVGNEWLAGAETLMGMGTFIHEFGHALGLPDFYITDYGYSGDDPVGEWSVMGGGSYVDNAYRPMGYLAYEKSFMGWLNIPDLTDAASVTLANPNDGEGQIAVLLRNPDDERQYFIFENRQPTTWTKADMGTGMLVTRVAYTRHSWNSNTLNNTQEYKRMMVVTANGAAINSRANSAHLFGNGVNQMLTQTLYDKTVVDNTPIYKIMKQPDGTVKFNFKDSSLPMTSCNNGEKYCKVTDISQIAKGDTVIIVCEEDGVALSINTNSNGRQAINIDVADGVAYGNDYVLESTLMKTAAGKWGFKVGSNTTYLGLTTTGFGVTSTAANALADITLDQGNATIKFSNASSNNTIGYTNDNVTFSCSDSNPYKVQIYRKGSVASGIRDINADGSGASDAIYNLNGQRVNEHQMGKGLYIINGKKIIK